MKYLNHSKWDCILRKPINQDYLLDPVSGVNQAKTDFVLIHTELVYVFPNKTQNFKRYVTQRDGSCLLNLNGMLCCL